MEAKSTTPRHLGRPKSGGGRTHQRGIADKAINLQGEDTWHRRSIVADEAFQAAMSRAHQNLPRGPSTKFGTDDPRPIRGAVVGIRSSMDFV